MDYPKFKVCCRCFTFNHSKYIIDTMNGFVMQQTNFPFVCTIVDDASTDGEQNVILNYMSENFDMTGHGLSFDKETDYARIVFARHKKNINCYFAVLLLKENHYSQKKSKMDYLKEWKNNVKYEAICEGDDYWTSPKKLQTQADYLDSHPDMSMCFHRVGVIAEEGRTYSDIFGYLTTRDYSIKDNNEMFKKWLVPTGSIMHRSEIIRMMPKNEKFIYGDNVLIATCLQTGPIHCFGESMGVYRLVPTGYTGTNSGVKFAINQISQLKGLQEEFEFYKCPTIWKYLERSYFEYLTFLKDNRETNKCNDVYEEYKSYFAEYGTSSFDIYYINKKVRKLASKIKHLIFK